MVTNNLRHYSNDEKLAVIQMRDSGMSYEAIAQKTGYSRVNMEKWCSQKVWLR
jgi:transposase-like protein